MGLVVAPIAFGIMVIAAALRRQHGIETLGIEIEQVDLMACLLQPSQRLLANGGVKAVVERMAIDIQHAHLRALCSQSSASCLD